MEREKIELPEAVQVAKDVEKRVKTTGVRGLDFEACKELGVFQRISNLLCATHATIMAAYRIYGGVDYLINEMNAHKNEIALEMNNFEKAFGKFVRFWTDYYAHEKAGQEVNTEMESLYHNVMSWMQMPETWQLGDEQRTKGDDDIMIRFQTPDKQYTFRKASVNNEELKADESWCVLQFNVKTMKQTVVEADMDKASAMMVAKRMSNDDTENIYTAGLVRDVVEKRTDITPIKAFKANETIGKITNVIK